MGWNYLSIPKPQRGDRWSLEISSYNLQWMNLEDTFTSFEIQSRNGCLTSSWEYLPLWYVVHVRFWVEITYQLWDNRKFLYWWTRHLNIQITAWPKLDRTQTKPQKIGNEAMRYTGNSFTVVKMFSIYLHDPHLGPECFHLGRITLTSQLAQWSLKSPASRLFAQPFVQA